ncbi:MAG: thioesterase family protein [Rhodospirillales bacterium]|nr:thioesterase family protein [Rhodospirillales bacterium]MDH3793274.1 thioesterase family protein [Rhodospirillales bacterium]MDH3911957.1 thioesterase family protein [Rhodospirillales bacterium]MDH3967642.1 thioesterase family protein [Rhodospirillales bacterium]
MAEWITTYRGTVYPRHLDHMGHMNVQYYVEKFDEGVWHLFAALGLTPGYMRERKRGMAAVEMNIKYKRELYAGDLIVVRSGVLAVTAKSLRMLHEMTNGETGEVAAIQEAVAVHLDREARRAIPFPEEIAARARARIVTPPETS